MIINKKINLSETLPAKLIEEILTKNKTEEISTDELKSVIKKVLKDNPGILKDYQMGKENVLQFAIGQVMYIIKRRIDINIIKQLLLEELK